MLTDGELTNARAAVLSTLTETAEVRAVGSVANSSGGTRTAETVLASYPARVETLWGGGEQQMTAQPQAVARYLVTLPYDAVLTAANVLVCAGRRFQAISVIQPASDPVDTQVWAVEVT